MTTEQCVQALEDMLAVHWEIGDYYRRAVLMARAAVERDGELHRLAVEAAKAEVTGQ